MQPLSLLLLSTAANVFSSVVAAASQIPLQTKPLIRNATINDVSAITDIIVDAWEPAPETKYVYQFRDQHFKFHWECTRRQVEQFFKGLDEDTIVHVIDASIPGDKNATKAVSLAIWELGRQETTASSFSLITSVRKHCSRHLDLNVTRALHWSDEFVPYKRRYIDNVYQSQVYLSILGTHPDYDGRGFGAAQCEWGKNLARDREENLTLIASPPGYQLYATIDFQEIANLTFTKVGGAFLTWYEVMVFVP